MNKANETIDKNQLIKEWIKTLGSEAQEARQFLSFYKCAIMEVETKFKVLDEQFSVKTGRNPIETIKTRLKSPQSLYTKLRKHDMINDLSFQSVSENIFDIAGIRVICPVLSDIYYLADCLLRQDDVRLIKKKDYIKDPKPNGYRSLHLIIEIPIFLDNETKKIPVEVQLRTLAMDCWASLEHHLMYKHDEAIPPKITAKMKNCADTIAELDTAMQDMCEILDG